MKQSLNNSQHTSESQSVINNLSIFTKNPSHLHHSNSLTSSEKMLSDPIPQEQFLFVQKNKGYHLIEWLIVISSIFTALITVVFTRHFYILQILLNANFNDRNSIIQAIKLYSLALIVVFAICSLVKIFFQKSLFVDELSQYQHKSVCNFFLFITLCLFLFFVAKYTTTNKKQVDRTFTKISHFIAWFVLGEISAFGGFLFGGIFSTKAFRVYGEIITTSSFIMVISSILSHTFTSEIDIFDMIG